jgi:hypothetical protein
MTGTKRNRSFRKIGKGRGVPLRLLRAIAGKYSLGQSILWTYDRQRRQRILSWGSSDGPALVAAGFAKGLALSLGWPEESAEFEISFVRRTKRRIKELETALARIVDGVEDPIGLARAAGKFPDESDGENLGHWVFYPQGKLSLRRHNGSAEALRRDVPVGEARREADLEAIKGPGTAK